ncbi:hypothetical protein FHW67_002709 [Herbaspirillum sp. Sphag1AN]|uniref:phage tail protein n=1 Tax=unclassified Herbaspirillum TaxID=2624150 RepID=UPI00161347B5|nr:MULTISPECIES: phage tail protein [unclassified Herbaspirillum]MBB3213417.1 hypothetical protein [Herbaspirillum sp. Sphag1AN]MBB3246539.1 hypothetical protein [Herbaspirillum sp. Sphag64]
MFDLHHYYGSDLEVSATGDLLVADATTTGEQRCYRRLLTNPAMTDSAGNVTASPDYTFAVDYGAGIGRRVGSPVDLPEITALIKAQMQLESGVSQSPIAPDVELISSGEVLGAVIRYTDANTGQPVILNFDVSQ